MVQLMSQLLGTFKENYVKFIFGIILLILSLHSFAQAPKVQGVYSASGVYSPNISLPNKGATKLNGTTSLLETGNKNILDNPSFEHATATTGWSTTINTPVLFTSGSVDGKNHIEVQASAASLDFYQDSTINNSAFADGVQGIAYIYVKTALANIWVCPKNAGTRAAINYCVSVNNNNKWALYKVPFILGATSNGVGVYSLDTSGNAVAVTGSVKVDDAFVGAQSVTQNSNSITSQSAWANAAASFAAGTITKPTLVSNGSGLYSYNSSTGYFTVLKRSEVKIQYAFTTTANSTITNVIRVNEGDKCASSTPPSSGAWGACGFVGIMDVGETFYFYNYSATGAHQLSVSAISADNTSTYSSTNADTDWQSCGHTTSSFTSMGTVTAIETQCKRQGGDLLMKGKFISGTPTASEARLSLPLWNGVQLVSKGTGAIPSLQQSGDLIKGASSTTYFRSSVLIEPSVSYVTFGIQTTTANGLSKALQQTALQMRN
jgi:hypothetical protein